MQKENRDVPLWREPAITVAAVVATLGLFYAIDAARFSYCNTEHRKVEGRVAKVESLWVPYGGSTVGLRVTLGNGTVFRAAPDEEYKIADHVMVRINKCGDGERR